MTTMLWKEWRENLKWAVLAMLGLAMAEFYALNQQQFFGFYVQEAAPLCKTSFLMITTFGCAAVGLVLGLVQLLPEQRRDQWAALIHRPVPRATIFRGKAVAGLVLYLAATIVPFAACVWYVATPNHFAAPFTPRMIYPGVADICAGAMYYFAALFVALHRGPWYGTRALGFMAAVSGSFVVTNSYEPFYVAVEATVLLSLALFTAAWGAMLSNGTLHAQPWLARVAVVAVVFYGVTAAGEIAGMIWGAFGHQEYGFGEQYIVDIDGRPLKLSTDKNGHNHFMDLNGNVVNDERLSKGLDERNTINFTNLSSYIGNSHGARHGSFFRGYRSSGTYMQSPNIFGNNNGEIWYYLPLERLFEGYNQYTRIRLGELGQDGFAPGFQRARPFQERMVPNLNDQIFAFVLFGSTVDYIDLGQRTVTPVFAERNTQVFGAGPISPYGDDPATHNLAAVALLDRLLVIDNTGKVLAVLSYNHDVDRWGSLTVGIKTDKDDPAKDILFLRYNPSQWVPWDTQQHMPSFLEEANFKGQIQKNYTLPPLPPVFGTRTWQTYVRETLETGAFFYGDIIYDKIGAELGSKRMKANIEQMFGPMRGYMEEMALQITIFSLILAIATLVWARALQFSWRRAWAWAGFVLAFNLAGLITLRLVADWPILVKCPSCGKKRLVQEPTCPHCHAPWPTPAKDGTEIMDGSPAPVLASV